MANSLEDRLLSKAQPEPAPTVIATQDQEQTEPKQESTQIPAKDDDVESTESVETAQPEIVIAANEGNSTTQTNLTVNTESSSNKTDQLPINTPPENKVTVTQEDPPVQDNEPANIQKEVEESSKAASNLEVKPETNRTNVVVNQQFITGPGRSETGAISSNAPPSTTDDSSLNTIRNKPPLVRSSQPGVTPLPQGMPVNPYKYLLPGAPLPGNRNLADSWFNKGNRAFQRNDFAEAIGAYEKAVMEDPSYFHAYFNLGLAALKGGDTKKALPAYEYALAIKPNDRDSRYNLSLGLEKLNHFRDAARELERLLKENPADTQVLMRLGNLYSGPLQRPVRTREIYRELLKVSPGSPESIAAQSWLYENP
jgi:tetratricopeptide (TPR) repeat protein